MLLAENWDNNPRPFTVDARKVEVEAHLPENYAGWTRGNLLALDMLNAHRSYYKTFFC